MSSSNKNGIFARCSRAVTEYLEYASWRQRHMTPLQYRRSVGIPYLTAEQSEARRIHQVVNYLVEHGGV
jgi:hypothetical protein